MLGSVASVASRGQAWGPHGPLCAGLSPGAGRMLPSVAWAVGSPPTPRLPSCPFLPGLSLKSSVAVFCAVSLFLRGTGTLGTHAG